MSKLPRTCGARFSVVDGVFVALCVAAAWLLRERLNMFVWLIPVTVGHFLLFCNIFRIRRSYELIWTAVFLANMVGWMFSGGFTWLGVLAIQLPLTGLFLGLELRSPRYHGACSRKVNRAHIDKWLTGRLN